jgi:hypothetical protein
LKLNEYTKDMRPNPGYCFVRRKCLFERLVEWPNGIKEKNICKKIGMIKKIITSLQSQKNYMQQTRLHIQKSNWFSPDEDYLNRGACYAAE